MVLFFMIVVHISICNYCTSSSTVLSSGSGTVLYHFDAEINLAVLWSIECIKLHLRGNINYHWLLIKSPEESDVQTIIIIWFMI
jgi:hypothetical protein